MIRGRRRYAVTIRFDREAGRNVADTLWHSTQMIEWEPEGSCVFRCDVDGLDEIVWWVLGYGPHARVVAPVELQEMLCGLVECIRDLYRGRKQAAPAARSPADRRRKAGVAG